MSNSNRKGEKGQWEKKKEENLLNETKNFERNRKR